MRSNTEMSQSHSLVHYLFDTYAYCYKYVQYNVQCTMYNILVHVPVYVKY